VYSTDAHFLFCREFYKSGAKVLNIVACVWLLLNVKKLTFKVLLSWQSFALIGRPITSLGHQEGQRVFREGPTFFELCPIFYWSRSKLCGSCQNNVALRGNLSGPVSATDPIKSLKDSASLVVYTQKMFFGWELRIFLWVTS